MTPINHRFWTASNAVSMFRAVLTIPVVWFLLHDQPIVAMMVCFAASGTDWLDGWIARKTNTVSEWGKVLDPMADKILVGAVVVILLWQERLPLWFVACVVARDVIIVVGGIWARRYQTEILPSLWSGKFAVSAIALTGVVAMVTSGAAVFWLIVLSSVLMVVSLWSYGKRLYGIVR